MTTISSRSRKPRPLMWVWILVFVVMLGALALWRSPLQGFLGSALSPITALSNTLNGSRAELASTTAALADRNELYQENVALKAMLGRNAAVPQILAGVLMRPPQTPYDTLLIDAGSEDGVAAGEWVSAGGGAVIGSVRDVEAHTASVQLLSQPGAQYQGMLRASDSTTLAVTLVGQGGGSMSAQVPSGTKVGVGSTIAIPGIAEGIEGSVSAVESPLGQAFETLYVQLPANPEELQYVEVWKNN